MGWMETDLLMFDDSDGFALPGADQEGIVVGQLLLIGRCRWRRGVRLGVVAVVGRRHDVGRQGRRVESCLHLLHCAIAVVVSVARLHHRLLLFSNSLDESKNQTNPETTLFSLSLSTKQPNSCQHTPELFFYFRPIPHCHKIKRFNIHSNNNKTSRSKTFIEIHQIKIVHFATFEIQPKFKKTAKTKKSLDNRRKLEHFFNRKEKMMKSIFFGWVGVRQTNEFGETE
jgi:hypothetical protein